MQRLTVRQFLPGGVEPAPGLVDVGREDDQHVVALTGHFLFGVLGVAELGEAGRRLEHPAIHLHGGAGRQLSWLERRIGDPGDRGTNPGHCYNT